MYRLAVVYNSVRLARTDVLLGEQHDQSTASCWREWHRRTLSGTTSGRRPWSACAGCRSCRSYASCNKIIRISNLTSKVTSIPNILAPYKSQNITQKIYSLSPSRLIWKCFSPSAPPPLAMSEIKVIRFEKSKLLIRARILAHTNVISQIDVHSRCWIENKYWPGKLWL